MTTTTNFLAQRAIAAFHQDINAGTAGLAEKRGRLILRIRDALDDLGFEAVGEPFVNAASGSPCIPLIAGGWDDERETQIHAVAAEWGETGDECYGPVLVADLELDEGWRGDRLYPAGRLTDLASIGAAVERGGRVPVEPETVRQRVDVLFGKALREATAETAAMVEVADAICTALLDVAAAIREGR